VDPAVQLIYDIIIRAYRDVVDPPSREPERRDTALRFLRHEGAEIIEALGITTAERVRKWTERPSDPAGETISELAARTELEYTSIKSAIDKGELPAFLPHGLPQGYRIREEDAAAWLAYKRIWR
jgi:hypothetical protein